MSKSHFFIDSKATVIKKVISVSIWDLSTIHLHRSPITQKIHNVRSRTRLFHILLTLNRKLKQQRQAVALPRMPWTVSCVHCWLLECLPGEADLTQEPQCWTQVPQTQCVAEMRITVHCPLLDPGLCDWLHMSEEKSEVWVHQVVSLVLGAPLCWAEKEAGSLNRASCSMLAPCSEGTPTSLRAFWRLWWKTRPSALHAVWQGSPHMQLPHVATVSALPWSVLDNLCWSSQAKPSQAVWARRPWNQHWVYEVKAISRFTVWIVSTGNDFVCTVTVHFFWTPLLH